jgi:MFS family permease
MGALELVLALQHSELGAAVLMVCIGIVMSSVTSNASATLQLDVSDHVRVRMLSLYSYGWIGTSPLSGLLAGWLSDSGGPGLAFAVGGGAMVLVAALGFGANRLARRNPAREPGSGTDGQEGDRAVRGGLDPGNARG